MPARTPAAANPFGGGDAHTSTPESRSPAVSGRPSARFAFCTACPAAPLPRLSSAQTTMPGAGGAVGEDADLGGVGALDARELGRDPLGQHGHGRGRRIGGLERLAQAVGRPDVARCDQAAPDGEQMRDEADREAERLLDLGRVLVRADLVGRDVLEHRRRVRRRLQRPPRTRHARLGVDDHTGRVDRAGERREREQHGGRVATGVRDQRAVRREELRDRVVPVAERRGVRMLEAVPLGIERRAS